MPLTLTPPKAGRSKFYRVRGTHLGVYLDRSTETANQREAQELLKKWRDQIRAGEATPRARLTFANAAVAYMNAGGEDRFLKPILNHFGRDRIAEEITQADIDDAAQAILPNAPGSTRNRQVYTPISAVLVHNHIALRIKRPKGAQGTPCTHFLRTDEVSRLLTAASEINAELAILFTLIYFTGLRLSEALSIMVSDIDLDRETAICGHTKNGDPRAVYLPPVVVGAFAGHPDGPKRHGRFFGFQKDHSLYDLAYDAYERAEVDPKGRPFHLGRHTFGAEMTRLGADLVTTGIWKSRTAAACYEHFTYNDEARKAAALPGASI